MRTNDVLLAGAHLQTYSPMARVDRDSKEFVIPPTPAQHQLHKLDSSIVGSRNDRIDQLILRNVGTEEAIDGSAITRAHAAPIH